MKKPALPAFLMLALLLPAAPSFAVDADDTLADPALHERYETVTRELRCLVCQNQTIAESHAPLAIDLRNQVRERLKAGASESEVVQFMVDRYGDFVLYKPQVKPLTWPLWFGPFCMLLVALWGLWRYLRLRKAALQQLSPVTPAHESHEATPKD